MRQLSHLDARRRPRMVDVSGKELSQRFASAAGTIRLSPETVQLVAADKLAKGNVLITAELAGVQAAKQTSTLIPLCHPLPLTGIVVQCTLETAAVSARSEVKCTDRTGVEMEALTAVAVALLTVYDMCKAVDKNMVISDVRLIRKTKRAITRPASTPPANAVKFLAAPLAANGQVGRGCRQTLSLSKGHYPTPAPRSPRRTRDRQSPRAAKQNEKLDGITPPAPAPPLAAKRPAARVRP